MRIAVLSGSPKGEKSVMLQYVRYVQKVRPQHQMEMEHVVPRIEKLESVDAFLEIIDKARAADGVLGVFPAQKLLQASNGGQDPNSLGARCHDACPPCHKSGQERT